MTIIITNTEINTVKKSRKPSTSEPLPPSRTSNCPQRKRQYVHQPSENDTEDTRARDREDARNGRRSDDRRKERGKRAACNTLRAVAQCIVYVCCTGCGAVLWVKRFSCFLCVCSWMGRCGGPRGSTAASSRLTTSRSGAPGRTVGEVEDLRKAILSAPRVMCLACHLCVRVPRVLECVTC